MGGSSGDQYESEVYGGSASAGAGEGGHKLYAFYFYPTSQDSEGNLSGCGFVRGYGSNYIFISQSVHLSIDPSIYQFIHPLYFH